MKNILKKSVYVMFVALVAANIYIFMSGVALSDEINHYEDEISRLHQENIDLAKKAYDAQSLSFAADQAAKLDFTEKSTPIYLENMKYALNR